MYNLQNSRGSGFWFELYLPNVLYNFKRERSSIGCCQDSGWLTHVFHELLLNINLLRCTIGGYEYDFEGVRREMYVGD